MSMAAVLEEDAATPGTHVDRAQPAAPRRPRSSQDDIDHPTWHLTLNGVLAKSSNIGTILATGQLGKTQTEANQVLYSYLRKFGIGRPTGLGFPGETSGILAHAEKWNASQQYTIPFGQGLSLNAVQAASVYSTIANGGVRVDPTLVRGTTGPDGRFTPAPRPEQDAGWSARRPPRPCRDAGVRRRRRGGHRHQGADPRLPRRAARPVRPTGWTRRPAATTATPPPSPVSPPPTSPASPSTAPIQNPTKGSYFGGQICGPDLQAGHGVRPEDPPGPAHRRQAPPAPGRPSSPDDTTEPSQEPPVTTDHPGAGTRNPRHGPGRRAPLTSPPRGRAAPGTLTAVPQADQSQPPSRGRRPSTLRAAAARPGPPART